MIATHGFISSDIPGFDQALDAFVDLLDTDSQADPSGLIRRFPHRADEIQQTVRAAKQPTSWIDDVAMPPLRGVATTALPEQIGPYRVTRMLGIGGMGIVYQACHQRFSSEETQQGKSCAVKVIHPELDRPHFVERFQYEQACLKRLHHPCIVAGLDAGTTADGHHYLAMELVQGDDLMGHCLRYRLNLRQRLRLIAKVCGAVASVHAHGILHRDLKPANILVSHGAGTAVPKIIDFGLAKSIDDLAGFSTAGGLTTQLLGTLQYMSPEQAAQRSSQVDERSDVFSLGVILFELLTGTTPLQTELGSELTIAERLRRVRQQERASLTTRLGELQNDECFATFAELDALCRAALALDPRHRPSSAQELAQRIRHLEAKV